MKWFLFYELWTNRLSESMMHEMKDLVVFYFIMDRHNLGFEIYLKMYHMNFDYTEWFHYFWNVGQYAIQ